MKEEYLTLTLGGSKEDSSVEILPWDQNGKVYQAKTKGLFRQKERACENSEYNTKSFKFNELD